MADLQPCAWRLIRKEDHSLLTIESSYVKRLAARLYFAKGCAQMLLGIAAIIKAVAWPIAVTMLIWKLKDTISDFLRRVVKGEATSSGIKLEMQASLQSTGNLDESVVAQKDERKVRDENIPPQYREEYESARQLLERDFPDGSGDKVAAALRLYAVASTERRFERIHRIIFGSQLTAIVQVNMLGGRVPVSMLRDQYNSAIDQYPEFYKTFSFDAWLEFLLNANLLRVESGMDGEKYFTINESTRAYLHYIIAVGLPPRSY